MADPVFLDFDDIIYIHKREIERAGGDSGVRDAPGIEASIGAPQAGYGDKYLMDLFDMAAAYLVSLVIHHPFLDGNKRTGTAAALTFLKLNGYDITEAHPTELADIIIERLSKSKFDREYFGNYFRSNSTACV